MVTVGIEGSNVSPALKRELNYQLFQSAVQFLIPCKAQGRQEQQLFASWPLACWAGEASSLWSDQGLRNGERKGNQRFYKTEQ